MSRDHIPTLAILCGMAGLFLWDRLRYDVVAMLALLAGVAAGIVPAARAFSGFANPVLPLIAGALVVGAAVGRSGAVEIATRRLMPLLGGRRRQVGVLAVCVALASAFLKNISALALFIPVAFRVSRRSGRSPSEVLMPLGFASLLGGSATLIGTSPNMLASALRQQIEGRPFRMFDFTAVGAGIAACGVLYLAFGWTLIPRRRRPASAETAFRIEDCTSELRVAEGSPFAGRTVAEIEDAAGGEVSVTGLIRGSNQRQMPGGSWPVRDGDLLVVEADPQAVEQFARDGKLEVVGGEAPPPLPDAPADEEAPGAAEIGDRLAVVEAIVTEGGALVGQSASDLHLRERYRVNVLAIARRGRRSTARLRRTRFRPGDVIVFQGYRDTIHDTLAGLGCLPLAERNLRLGRPRRLLLPLALLGLAVAAAATRLVPAEIAFVGAAVGVALFGLSPISEIYAAVEWPILVLIGALIPLGEAVRSTGTADLVAGAVGHVAALLPGWGVLALVMAVTMLATPVLHHAASVLVMGPIAASLAHRFGYHVEPFLLAVAFGAGSDFLSPIGHQSNTLVMGPGGYHFGDYWRLGLPLSLIVIAVGVPLILIFWPLG